MDRPLNLEEAVKNLQLYLRTISFFDPRIERVPVDGIFASDTRKAVLSFQRTRGLTQTGNVDKETWDSIYGEYRNIGRVNGREPMENIFPPTPDDYAAEVGQESAFIAILQIMLREIGVIFDEIPDIAVNGVYTEETADAVKAFQRASLLDVTGKVDLETFNRLQRAFALTEFY